MIKVLKGPLWNYNNLLVSKYNAPSLMTLKRKYCAIPKHRDFKDVLRTSLLSKNPVIIFPKVHAEEFQHERQGEGSCCRRLFIG